MNVHSVITVNVDRGKVTALTLFNLRAAFDTIDHNILINYTQCIYQKDNCKTFAVYGTRLNLVANNHNFCHHLWRDDTHIYTIYVSTFDATCFWEVSKCS